MPYRAPKAADSGDTDSMPSWLLTSLILSVGLTVLLNVLPRLFPGAQARLQAKMTEQMQPSDPDGPRVRVFFPWKFMLIGSIALTVLLNLVR